MTSGILSSTEQTNNTAVQAEWERTFAWIGDTGALCHMLRVWSGFVDCKTTSARACIGMRDDEVDANAVETWKGRNHLSKKWNKSHSECCGFVTAHIAIQLARLMGMCIRNLWLYESRPRHADWGNSKIMRLH